MADRSGARAYSRSRPAATTPARRWSRAAARSLNVIASQGLLHARYGGVVPEIAARHHLELIDAVTADALERAGTERDEIETVAVTHRTRADRRAAGGPLVRQGAGGRTPAAAHPGRSPARPRGGEHARGRAGRGALPLSGGERRAYLHRPSGRAGLPTPCSARPSTTPPARPSTRALACWGWAIPEVRRRPARARGRSRGVRLPRSAPGKLDFSFSGLKTALLYRIRDLGDEAQARGPDLAASTSGRSWMPLTAEHAKRSSANGWAAWRSAEGWRPTPSCAPPIR